ncbi:hypothetical protein EOD39_1401 [Acipenser ruthenus]|uniref:CCHC-type domain-containing protein n=1 Tax=Acipenser ruthenus TaxID=7906 RepID=A0A444UCC7_ACIRT|nr:hypothetical protein EOD39_1401 [Acipenser ruthenus]
MDQWIRYSPDPSQTRWGGGLEDLLCGCEDQGWCLACGEFGHKAARCPFQEEEEVLPAQKRKRRMGVRSQRQAREPVPSPVPEREDLPALYDHYVVYCPHMPEELRLNILKPWSALVTRWGEPEPQAPALFRAPTRGMSQEQSDSGEREQGQPPVQPPEREMLPVLLLEREELPPQAPALFRNPAGGASREQGQLPVQTPEREVLPVRLPEREELPPQAPALFRAPAKGTSKE